LRGRNGGNTAEGLWLSSIQSREEMNIIDIQKIEGGYCMQFESDESQEPFMEEQLLAITLGLGMTVDWKH